MTLEAINKLLRPGDRAEIAELTGYKVGYVRAVLNPKNRRTNKAIIRVATDIARSRKARVMRQLQEMISTQ